MLERSRLVSLLALIFVLGCQPGAEAPETRPDPATVQGHAAIADEAPTSSQAGDPMSLGHIKTVAPYLPADTMILVTADIDALYQDMAFIKDLANATIGAKHVDAMIKDISTLLDERVGFDPVGVKWAAVGFSESGGGVIFLGGLKLSAKLPKEKVHGLDVIRPKAGSGVFVDLGGGIIALLPKERDIENFAKLRNGGATLVGSPRLTQLEGFAKEAGDGAVAFAISLEGPELQKVLTREFPPDMAGLKGGAVSIGGASTLSIAIKGDAASIKALASTYKVFVQAIQAKIADERAQIDQKSTDDAFGIIVAAHAFEGLIEQVKPTFVGDTARLELKLPNSVAGMSMTMMAAGAMMFMATGSEKTASEPMAAPVRVYEPGDESK